ncbi:MAG: stage III sporulation protein AF [Lachnospiraceae bacterium]|jgi:stage III sporulation protein AF|nr:stage III sporulation protein AF [Lachnospiraceae bacterium]
MVGIIKEICIFMIIAQAVLFFVPGNSYDKYVRILVGIIMILRFIEPLFPLLAEDGIRLEIENQMAILEQQMAGIYDAGREDGGEIKDSETEVYKSMEEEIKRQLRADESNYDVTGVRFTENVRQGKEGSRGADIIVTVKEKQSGEVGNIQVEKVKLGENEGEKTPEEGLKEMYANRIGIEAQRLEILLE